MALATSGDNADSIEMSNENPLFVDPDGRNRKQVDDLLAKVTTLLLDHLCHAAHNSALPSKQTLHSFAPDVVLPESGVTQKQILQDVKTMLTNSMNPANPGFIGHMDSMPAIMSFVGEMLSAAVNNNMLSAEMSPAFTRLENLLLKEIANWFELGDMAGGVMCSGGSLANFTALCVARNLKLDVQRTGLSDFPSRPVMLASEVAHTSLQKAAMLSGMGTDAVVSVAVNPNSQMRIADLKQKLDTIQQQGHSVVCIVATAGTTTTGSIDPLAEIAAIAREQNIWLHVDAAYGGGMVLSAKHKSKLCGIEQADSVTFNPQKWCYVAKTCAMVLFKDRKHLIEGLRTSAPYMQQDEGLINLGEIGIQGTRHAEVLKLWLTLRHLGRKNLERLVDDVCELSAYFEARIKAREDLELAGYTDTNIVCFRVVKDNLSSEAQDEMNTALQVYLLDEHNIFLSLPIYRKKKWLRCVVLNPFTTQNDIDRCLVGIDSFICHAAV